MQSNSSRSPVDVLLVQPEFRGIRIKEEPLGLMYMASVIAESGFTVKIKDYNIERFEKKELHDYLALARPKIVGISSITNQAQQAYEIGNFIKNNFPEITLVYGGVHSTLLPEEAFKKGSADFVIRGESELAFLELLKRTAKGQKIDDICGLCYLEAGKMKNNRPSETPENLDELPIPAYHLIPVEKYDTSIHIREHEKENAVNVMTSRGCPNDCHYCASPSLYNRKVRFRTPDNVVKEIEHVVDNYKIRNIHFHDDNFLLDHRRILKICDLLRKKGIEIRWICLANTTTIVNHPEILMPMKEAGCVGVEMGIESGDVCVLEKLNKKQSIKEIKKANRLLLESGITPMYLLMSYSMGENIDSPRKTAELVYGMAGFNGVPAHGGGEELYIMGHLARPSPGAKFYEMSQKAGMVLSRNWMDHHEERVNFIPKELLMDVPEKTGKISGGNALETISKYEKNILYYMKNFFYTSSDIVNSNFKNFDSYLKFIAYVYDLCDARKNMIDISRNFVDYFENPFVPVVSAVSILSIIGLVKSAGEKSNSMDAWVMEEKRKMRIEKVPVPEINDSEVLVGIRYAGVCGSDTEVFSGNREPESRVYPRVLGHEATGVVEKKRKDVKNVDIGDRVVIMNTWGCFAKYVATHCKRVVKIPEKIDLKTGTMLEFLPGIVKAIERADITPDTRVLIIGQGTSGLLLTRLASLKNPKILIAADILDSKLETSRKMGAHATINTSRKNPVDDILKESGGRPDVIILAHMSGEGVNQALDIIGYGGRIILYGCLGKATDVDFHKLHEREAHILTTSCDNEKDRLEKIDMSIGLLMDGTVKPGDIPVEVHPFSELGSVMELKSPESSKGPFPASRSLIKVG